MIFFKVSFLVESTSIFVSLNLQICEYNTKQQN